MEPLDKDIDDSLNKISSLDRMESQSWKIIGVVILAPFMTLMDSTIVNVSLSSIHESLHSTLAAAQWIITGYLLVLALMLPLNAWLVGQFGVKKLYLFCFSSFTFTSLLCGLAQTMPQLIAARVLQGAAGGLLTPLTQLMIARIAGKQMARVMGVAAVPVLLAPLLGPPLAGLILKYAEWRWLFYINLPVGILAVILAAIFIPHDTDRLIKQPFDLPGFLMLSPGLFCLLYGFEEYSYRYDAFILLLGFLLLGSFILYALRKKDKALIDIDLFRISTFSIAAVIQFLSNGLMYAGQFLVPLYLISGAGLSVSETGWILGISGLGMICVFPFIGHLMDKFGPRAVSSSGAFVNFLGTVAFLWMAHNGYSTALAAAALFVRGVGQGGTGLPSLAAAYASIPKSKLAYATTSINIVQRLGGPVLTTVLAIIISLSLPPNNLLKSEAFQMPFLMLNVFQICIIFSALQLPKRIV